MNFTVVGVGPVGGIAAAHLLRAGHQVTLVDIARERLEKMRRAGLVIRDPRRQLGGPFTVHPTRLCGSLAELEARAGVVLVAVKACVLEHLLADLAAYHRPGTRFVSFQNGLDCQELLATAIPPADVMRVVVNYAGRLVSDNEIEVTFFNSPNYLGASDPAQAPLARELAKTFTAAGIATEQTDEIKHYEWEKSILNAALSPVCAVTGLTMRGAMEHPPVRAVVERLLREGITEGERLGLEFPQDFLTQGMTYLEKGGYHKPSMLVDIEAGRATEIDFLNGKIAAYGRDRTPYHRMITALVKGLEQRNRGLPEEA